MRRFILFLIRIKLGVKKGQKFRFANQKNKNIYYFTANELIKMPNGYGRVSRFEKSLVSVNWVLSDECRIEKIDEWEKEMFWDA